MTADGDRTMTTSIDIDPPRASDDAPPSPGFRPLRLLAVVLAVLLLIGVGSRWYADEVALPRYCGQDEPALQRLAAVVATGAHLDPATRREHMVAAKLAYLLPRHADETIDAYLQRLRHHLLARCRTAAGSSAAHSIDGG